MSGRASRPVAGGGGALVRGHVSPAARRRADRRADRRANHYARLRMASGRLAEAVTRCCGHHTNRSADSDRVELTALCFRRRSPARPACGGPHRRLPCGGLPADAASNATTLTFALALDRFYQADYAGMQPCGAGADRSHSGSDNRMRARPLRWSLARKPFAARPRRPCGVEVAADLVDG